MINQKKAILRYIEDYGSITPMEAFNDLGITKLATRISEMRSEDGLDFNVEMVDTTNRYGRKVRFARYTLKEDTV